MQLKRIQKVADLHEKSTPGHQSEKPLQLHPIIVYNSQSHSSAGSATAEIWGDTCMAFDLTHCGKFESRF